MRWSVGIAALLAVSCAMPDAGGAESQAANTASPQPFAPAKTPAQTGQIWSGTVGGIPITACFDNAETDEGIYYYNAHLRPLRLVQIDENTPSVLTEIEGYRDQSGATWTIDAKADQRIAGTWRSGDRELPIELSASPVDLPEFDGPCASAAFVEPLLVGGSAGDSRASFDGAAYTKLVYTGPPHLGGDDYLVETIALDPVQAGDRAINTALAKALPDGSVGHHMGQCLGMHMPGGGKGYLNETITPALITDQWLSIERAGSTFCGGAHPSHFFTLAAYDRSSGNEADPSTWFKPDALLFYEFESEDGPLRPRPIAGLSEALVDKVQANWPHAAGSECPSAVRTQMGWTLGLAKDGVVFVPQLPHVIFACTDAITVPWDELAPFLSDAGQDVRGSLQ